MIRRKRQAPYVHPLDLWLVKQCAATGGVKIWAGTLEFKAWAQWRRIHKLKTAGMEKAAKEDRPYMVPTRWPDYKNDDSKGEGNASSTGASKTD